MEVEFTAPPSTGPRATRLRIRRRVATRIRLAPPTSGGLSHLVGESVRQVGRMLIRNPRSSNALRPRHHRERKATHPQRLWPDPASSAFHGHRLRHEQRKFPTGPTCLAERLADHGAHRRSIVACRSPVQVLLASRRGSSRRTRLPRAAIGPASDRPRH